MVDIDEFISFYEELREYNDGIEYLNEKDEWIHTRDERYFPGILSDISKFKVFKRKCKFDQCEHYYVIKVRCNNCIRNTKNRDYYKYDERGLK